jgi:uncharacterized protein YutE (UPF0331/DUF86 family)
MLMIVAQIEDIIDSRIRNIIHNMDLFSEAKHLHKQLEPIAKALDKLQSDSSSIADACEIWLDLIKTKELEPYKDKVDKMFKQAMTPSHFLANILHPMYKGKNLTPGQISIAQEMLLESYLELVSELLGFMSDSVKLPKALQHDLTLSKIKPVVWWLCTER